MQMSRACEAMEIRRFPILRRRLDEVMGKFLRDGVKPAEKMIRNIIEMEVIDLSLYFSFFKFYCYSRITSQFTWILHYMEEHMVLNTTSCF